MNERIRKKISKRLVDLFPEEFKHAFKISSVDELPCGVIPGTYCTGGGVSYWGEGEDMESVLESYMQTYGWSGVFGWHPSGHQYFGYPLIDRKRLTGKRIIQIAKIEASLNFKSSDCRNLSQIFLGVTVDQKGES